MWTSLRTKSSSSGKSRGTPSFEKHLFFSRLYRFTTLSAVFHEIKDTIARHGIIPRAIHPSSDGTIPNHTTVDAQAHVRVSCTAPGPLSYLLCMWVSFLVRPCHPLRVRTGGYRLFRDMKTKQNESKKCSCMR